MDVNTALQIDVSVIDEITSHCCYDVREIHLDARTLIELVDALYPITPKAAQCDACQGTIPSIAASCGACDRVSRARRLFHACCDRAATMIYPNVTSDMWKNSSSMLELIRRELPTETPPSQDIVDTISTYVVAQEMSLLKVVRFYRYSGGLAADRYKEAMDRAGLYFLFQTVEHDAETVLYLYEGFDASLDIPWDKICSLTELGNKDPDTSGAQRILLPSPFDNTLTTFLANEDEVCVTLLPACATDHGVPVAFTEKAERSLTRVLENHARRSCVIHWSCPHLFVEDLPTIPPPIKALKLCGMPQFLGNRVPNCIGKRHHWIHAFVAKLKNMEHLTLSDCGYRPQDLINLHCWLPSLKYIQVKENDWIVKDGVLLIATESDESFDWPYALTELAMRGSTIM